MTENDTLYCGFTDNVERRFQKHLEGTAAKYTRANKPLKVVFTREFETKQEAMKEEHRIKQLSRKEKNSLIESSEQNIN